ncbi:acetoacetate--CoA ligase [Rhodococcus koreensis]|uniref:acetoacetate--CoA ligase n=1 Tax=Rhodococcus koreensis TaxID=99653 RepID=UPI00366E7F84
MHTVEPGTLLLAAPSKVDWGRSRAGRFLLAIEEKTEHFFADYEDAWQWSVDHLEEFWEEVWNEFEVITHTPYTAVLEDRCMPGAKWFPGATLNYTEHIARAVGARADDIMVQSFSQTNGNIKWTGARLLEEIGRIQQGMIRLGIKQGDCVAGYLPNIPETLAAYLAATALGAVWCSVAPEMGTRGVLDRITQLEPALVLAVDGYRWGAKEISRAAELDAIREALPDAQTVLLPYLDPKCDAAPGITSYADLTADKGEIVLIPVSFDHPLTVLFSSGTTGRPKAIVHSHGGLLLEHFKSVALHMDLGPQDTAFWYTTTGWMVWTLMVSSLLTGTALVLEDGDPAWPATDGEWSQWAVAAAAGATFVATSSAYLASCAHSNLDPGERWNLGRLREIFPSGSPLAADVAAWVYSKVNPTLLLAPTSGGTDVCSAFVGGSPLVAVYAGEMSCRPLGIDVDALDPEGRPLREAPGELVVSKPMPSMPVFFWGDDNFKRYRESYFTMYPGRWRHGDWLVRTERNTWVITGRSDATLNRGGVRLGTAEFYSILDPLPDVDDSMVLHFEDGTGMGKLVLALVPAPDSAVDQSKLAAEVRRVLRTELSPRHVPDHVVVVPSIPRNSTGKRLEIPLKRIVKGVAADDAIDLGVVAKPEDLAETADRISQVLTQN